MKQALFVILSLLILSSCRDKNQVVQTDAEQEAQAGHSSEIQQPEEPLPGIDLVMGKFNPAIDTNFIRIESQYTDKAVIFLQKEAYGKFVEMHEHALTDGIELKILSATRPFGYQKNIWERKWAGLLARGWTNEKEMVGEILKYSAMPGTSRHHWGTDIDLNYLNNVHFETGKGQAIYNWLTENASEYGFCQPYTAKGEARPNGYEEEKWHWSYLPLANRYFEAAKKELNDQMISGFSGSTYASELNVVEHYILGIDPACF